MGVLDTYKESNAASNRELARNFPNPPSEVDVLAANRRKLGISATDPLPLPEAGQVLAPTGVATPPAMLPANAKAAGYTIAQPIAQVTPQGSPVGFQTGNGKTITDFLKDNPQAPPIPPPGPLAGASVSVPGSVPGIAMQASGPAPINQITGKNADGTAFDNNAALAGITQASNRAKQQDRQIATYDSQVADATRRNAIEKNFQDNKTVAQRINDLQSGNTTWDMKPEDMKKIAGVGFDAQQKVLNDEKVLASQTYTADQKLAGDKLKAITDVTVANIGSDGKVNAAIAAHQNDQGKAALKAKEDDEKRISTLIEKAGGNPADPQNRSQAQQYVNNYANYNNGLAATFNKMSPTNATQYHAMYKKYTMATPEQRAELDKSTEYSSMKSIITTIAQKHGIDPFSRPKLPTFVNQITKPADPVPVG